MGHPFGQKSGFGNACSGQMRRGSGQTAVESRGQGFSMGFHRTCSPDAFTTHLKPGHGVNGRCLCAFCDIDYRLGFGVNCRKAIGLNLHFVVALFLHPEGVQSEKQNKGPRKPAHLAMI